MGLSFHLLRGQPLREVNCEIVARLQSDIPFLGHLTANTVSAVLAARAPQTLKTEPKIWHGSKIGRHSIFLAQNFKPTQMKDKSAFQDYKEPALALTKPISNLTLNLIIVRRFSLLVKHQAGKWTDIVSSLLWLSFLFKNCDLWTLSCDFALKINGTLKMAHTAAPPQCRIILVVTMYQAGVGYVYTSPPRTSPSLIDLNASYGRKAQCFLIS